MPDTQNVQENKLIAFIITAYNLTGKMLEECLNSITELSLRPEEREIILVDDGSAVSPLLELAKFADDIVYIRQPNKGLSAARNAGLRMATAKYVHFIDGDDYLIRVPYEHCADIVRYENPDIVLFNQPDCTRVTPPFSVVGPATGSEYMGKHNISVTAWSYIFRRDKLGSLRFEPGLLHEDEQFTPQLLLQCERVFATDCRAYFYRARANSLTRSKDMHHHIKRLADIERTIYYFQSMLGSLPDASKMALERRIAQLTMDFLYNTIKLTHSSSRLDEAISRLTARGLFPLPDKHYTRNYTFFRKAINSSVGRKLLVLMCR